MSDTRGNFSYVDITQEMIDASTKEYFGVVTGAFMTDRERTVIFYKDPDYLANQKAATMKGKAAPKKRIRVRKGTGRQRVRNVEEQIPQVYSEERILEDMYAGDRGVTGDPGYCDAQDWLETQAKQSNYRYSGDSSYRSNSIRIRGCVNEWMCTRHFLNSGIPFGPHPLDQDRLCWYSRPLYLASTTKTVCRQKRDYIEYRDLPTPYNLRMRAIYHLVVMTPEIYAHRRKHMYLNQHWVLRALQHFSWLDPTLVKKYGGILAMTPPSSETVTLGGTTTPTSSSQIRRTSATESQEFIARTSLPSNNVVRLPLAARSQYNSTSMGMQSSQESSPTPTNNCQQQRHSKDRGVGERASKRQRVSIM